MSHQLKNRERLVYVILFVAMLIAFAIGGAQAGGVNVLAVKALRVRNWANVGTDLAVGGNATVAGDLTATGNVAATGNVNSTGANVTGTFNRITKNTIITVTAASIITPTGSYQPITAAGVITDATLAASGFTAGDVVTIVNNGSNSITILDTGTAKLASDAALGQYDSLRVIFDGTNWVQISRGDN